MLIINAGYIILTDTQYSDILKSIESAGRICYKSESSGDSENFISNIIKLGHESVLEHQSISVRIICDRGVSHEIVRHRIASYSQESTRYCNYSSERFSGQLTFIKPCFLHDCPEGPYSFDNFMDIKGELSYQTVLWLRAMLNVEDIYLKMSSVSMKAQEARSVLPNSVKTELVMTMNLREWRHFFKLRTAIAAHPQMREITVPLLSDFK